MSLTLRALRNLFACSAVKKSLIAWKVGVPVRKIEVLQADFTCDQKRNPCF
jgi:hypothetical protein